MCIRDSLAGAKKLGYLPEKGPLYMDMTPFGLLDFFAEARGMKKASWSRSKRWLSSVLWEASYTSRLTNFPKGTDNVLEWPRL